MEFREIDPKGLSQERFRAEVAKGINAIHLCIHAGDKKREELAEDVAAIKGSVETLTDLFSHNTPAVKAKMGWLEHLKVAGSCVSAVILLALAYQLLIAIAPGLHGFLMGLKP